MVLVVLVSAPDATKVCSFPKSASFSMMFWGSGNLY